MVLPDPERLIKDETNLPWQLGASVSYVTWLRFRLMLISDKLLIIFVFYVGTFRADALSLGYVLSSTLGS